jgi:prolyl-tRNA synthetase
MNKEDVVTTGEDLYGRLLAAGVDAALDDREERAGFKFKDADLIGYPLQIIIGARSLESGEVEVKIRKTGEKKNVSVKDLVGFVKEYIQEQKA